MRLSRPTEFISAGRVHVWKDGSPFYVFDRPGTFTLPAGSYKVEGGAMLGPMPARAGAKDLPRPKFPLPRKVVLKYTDNPNKAQIDLRRGVVYLDNAFRGAPDFVRTFVLLHEIGHYYYADEASCDAFAAQEMYKRGYNPSQILAASRMSLSHHATERLADNMAVAKFLDDGNR